MRPIDADALRVCIMGEPPDAHYPSYYADVVDKAPTLDVQPVRRGEWEICWGEVLCCTVCGKSADDLIGGLEGANYIEEPNFCPNCGADMRKEGLQ